MLLNKATGKVNGEIAGRQIKNNQRRALVVVDISCTFGKTFLCMRFYIRTIALFLNVCAMQAQTNTDRSLSLISKLQRAEYDSCQAMFDTVVSNQVNAGMMKQIWESMPRYIGAYQSYGEIRNTKTDTTETVVVRCNFEKTKMDLQLVYNQHQKIIGIFFLPPKNTSTYNPPEYYKSHKLYESKVTLQSGKYALPGVLCIPNSVKHPPVAILLAGSGPNDKDETIGPNKLLKDLALGLGSNGIASFRYDKRTLAYGKEMAAQADMGIREEVIEDALSAVKIIRKNPLTKDSKIYIIGHSLGAMCAPLVAAKAKADGVVMMAGNARPLEDLLPEQFAYLFSADSLLDDTEKNELVKLTAQVITVKTPKALKTAKPGDLPLGLPSAYWQSLVDYKQIDVAKKLKQPVLVLQGERDYQVTMTDFNLWKQALGDQPKNTFISYPALNHLFMKGEGRSMPSEYEQQNNAEEKVITDISEWIKAKQ